MNTVRCTICNAEYVRFKPSLLLMKVLVRLGVVKSSMFIHSLNRLFKCFKKFWKKKKGFYPISISTSTISKTKLVIQAAINKIDAAIRRRIYSIKKSGELEEI